MKVGAAAGAGFAPIEQAYGKPLDRMRVYGWLGSGFPAGWSSLASAYGLDMSIKYLDVHGKPIPFGKILDKTYDPQLIAIAKACAALPPPPGEFEEDPHAITDEHEEDAKAAAATGNYDELNACSAHVANIFWNTPGFAANCLLGKCWTGYDIKLREPKLRPSLQYAEFIAVDPYLGVGEPWQTFDAIAGPVLDYLSAHEPTLRQYLWEFGCDNRPDRRAWLQGIPGSIVANPVRYERLKGMDYWNAGAFALDQPGLNALGSTYRFLSTL